MYKEILSKMLKSPAIGDIWKWSRVSHFSVLMMCVLNLLLSICALMTTIATRGLIDGVTGHIKNEVYFYAILLIVMVIVMRLLVFLLGIVNAKANAILLNDMRSMFLNKILKKKYVGLNGYHSGELVNRMFSDVSVVKNGVLDILPNIVSASVRFMGAAVILLIMDWRFVGVLVLGGFIGLGIIVGFKKPMESRHKAVQESEDKLHAVLQETLENLRLIKASGCEERMKQQVDRRQDDFLNAQLRKGYFSVYMNSGINVAFHLSWLFCMLWGCYGIYEGHLTYGMLAAIIQLVGQIQGPIASVAGVAGQIYGMISSAERLKDIIDLPQENDSECIDGHVLYQRLKEIKIEDMSFSYGRESEHVLEHVNVSIKPGDFVALTGISGGGKSTLFQLLLGIYQPSDGNIKFCFVNGDEEYASCNMRGLFAYVPQGNTLFSGTLRENLTMFTDYASDKEIMDATRIACIDDLIDSLDKGLDTVIGERGVGLSEGQSQRIAVARAILSKAPILLLDESTSALDEETEAQLLLNISSLKDKTCLIVTHRKAALDICDYRIHIEDSIAKIIELR